ncbi:MAG: methionine--tRNA ligase [Clostridiales bacterium]|nr:methionine--tRNA ligase [Clostridiales bacterium]
MEKPKYYITTAIAYASRKPHIGNTYEIILTDAIARFKRLQGYDVYFLTGTDEHGEKIQQLAENSKIQPKEYVDKVADEIKGIWNLMDTSYDKFIRTTDDYHEETVQKIFKRLYEQGDIYKGYYEGAYCTPCESFFTETQLVDGKCPDCGREVTQAREEAYFFKMSKYQDRLMKHIEDNPDFVFPESRKKEIVNNFLKPGLQDLCVSRTSFNWGVPVSFDNKHVVYVWIDALSNYITALGYKEDSKENNYLKYWPADLHVIGKDILRFHMIYWPIMLMALGEELPKHIYAHGWFLFGEDKMSKSKGNVIYADYLAKKFGVDATRFYCLSEMSFAQDGNITYDNIITKYNSELANTLGNLVNRTVAMANKYFDGKFTNPDITEEIDKDLINNALSMVDNVEKYMNEIRVADAVSEIFTFARRCNKYIDETMPWALAKDEEKQDRLKTVLFNLIESIRFIAVLLSAFMPQTSEKIFNQINSQEKTLESIREFGKDINIEVGRAEPLFVRIEEEKLMEEIKQDMEKQIEEANKENEVKEEKTNLISIDEFDKVELKLGKVLKVEKVEKADKLLKLEVDLGEENPRTIVSGIAKWYNEENLTGKLVVVVTNLKPVKLRGIESNGMLIAAGEEDVRLLTIDGELQAGTEIH